MAMAPRPPSSPRRLRDIALARSGDKGNRATLSLIALDPADYPLLDRTVTEARVRECYGALGVSAIDRYPLPQLAAVHLVLHDALGGGVTRSLALDAHGKTLASALLDLPLAEDA
jgi:hypothetical protein